MFLLVVEQIYGVTSSWSRIDDFPFWKIAYIAYLGVI